MVSCKFCSITLSGSYQPSDSVRARATPMFFVAPACLAGRHGSACVAETFLAVLASQPQRFLTLAQSQVRNRGHGPSRPIQRRSPSHARNHTSLSRSLLVVSGFSRQYRLGMQGQSGRHRSAASRRSTPTPRSTLASAPTGASRCVTCHPAEVAGYARSAMAHSLRRPGQEPDGTVSAHGSKITMYSTPSRLLAALGKWWRPKRIPH